MTGSNAMSDFVFPFSPPSPPDTPDTNTLTMVSPETSKTPNPGTLPIKRNPFNYLLATKKPAGDANPSRSGSITEPATSTDQKSAANMSLFVPAAVLYKSSATALRTNHFVSNRTFPSRPSKVHARVATANRARTSHFIEHFNEQMLTNPFSDDNALDTAPLPKPWLKSDYGRSSFDTSTINSSVETFHTATPSPLPKVYTPRGLLSTSQASLIPSRLSRIRSDPRFSLDRSVRIQEAHKRYNNKLRLERARDEVHRLDPSASTSTLHLPQHRTLAQRINDAKNPIPPLLRNVFFWLALLLLQGGLAGTAGVLGAIFTADRIDGNIKVGAWLLFALVICIVVFIVGLVGTAIISFRNGNVCLGMLDKLGLNEIRHLRQGDLEMGKGGDLLYLGVGDRDETSMLGGSSVMDGSLRSGRVGDWQSADGRSIVDSFKLKNPMWCDLYFTPDQSRVGFSMGSPAPRQRSKLKYNALESDDEDFDDMDIGAQRLRPTPSLRSEVASVSEVHEDDDFESTIADDEEKYIPNRDGAQGRQGFRGYHHDLHYEERGEREEDEISVYHDMEPIAEEAEYEEAKNSPQKDRKMGNDRTPTMGKETNTWSPLHRLGRAFGGKALTTAAKPKPIDDEEIEMADLNRPPSSNLHSPARLPREVSFPLGWSPNLTEAEREELAKSQAEESEAESVDKDVDVEETLEQDDSSSSSTPTVEEKALFVIGEEEEDEES